MNKKILNSPFLGELLVLDKKNEIKRFFNHTYELYESLFECLNDDKAFYQRPEPLRHPLIFYYGHTATFFINKLIVSKIITSRINVLFESLFAVGVDEMSWDDLNHKQVDWPRVKEVKQYKDTVRVIVNKVIDELPLGDIIDWDHPAWIILMGIEHELIHLETSSVLIRQLDIQYINKENKLWGAYQEQSPIVNEDAFVSIESEKIRLGISNPSNYYGWDNEYGEDVQNVPAFKAGECLVSNASYLAFVRDNGYKNDKWWTEEGSSWVKFKKVNHPVFWIEDETQPHGYRQRNLIEEVSLPMNWPVEVNYYEAKAFCNWYSEIKGIHVRLPSEYEWHCMFNQHFKENKDGYENCNIHLAHNASSSPVNMFKHGALYDVCGNVWQWTESPIRPFKGFKVHKYYDDFSIPTFDDKHYIIKGGSWISGGNCARKESRYSFRKHFFQHAGFRMVNASHQINENNSLYETDAASYKYLDSHYGEGYLNHEPFVVSIIKYASNFWEKTNKGHALDIGCSVGRSSFELSRYFRNVTGIDFSTHFIRYAYELKELKTIPYKTVKEGHIHIDQSINLKALKLEGKEKNVEFYQADACNMPDKFKEFDFVLAANLLDRLYDPKAFLEELPKRMNPNALLVISSPFTWKEEFTEKKRWLGGYVEGENSIYSHNTLKKILEKHFEFLDETQEIPFILKETSRKYEYILPYVGVWKKKSQ